MIVRERSPRHSSVRNWQLRGIAMLTPGLPTASCRHSTLRPVLIALKYLAIDHGN